MKRNFEEYHYLGGISIIRLNFIQKILYLRAHQGLACPCSLSQFLLSIFSPLKFFLRNSDSFQLLVSLLV